MGKTAKKAKACERHFFYEGRKRTLDFVTTITDDEAIDALGGFLAPGRNGEHAVAIGFYALGLSPGTEAAPPDREQRQGVGEGVGKGAEEHALGVVDEVGRNSGIATRARRGAGLLSHLAHHGEEGVP